MPRRLALGHAGPPGDADLPIKFHGIDLPALPARCRQDIGGRLLRRPKRDYPAATVVGFCTAALSSSISARAAALATARSEEHTSELQSLMRISYAVFCLKKKNKIVQKQRITSITLYRKLSDIN